MICPKCLSKNTGVIDSRPVAKGRSTRRRRACFKCKHRWSTIEVNVLKFRYSFERELKKEYRDQIVESVKAELRAAVDAVLRGFAR